MRFKRGFGVALHAKIIGEPRTPTQEYVADALGTRHDVARQTVHSFGVLLDSPSPDHLHVGV